MLTGYYRTLAPQNVNSPLPEVWVSEQHAYNAGADRMEITWRLSISQAPATDLNVLIYHSNTTDGAPTNYTWVLPAGQSYTEAPYFYPTANTEGYTELVFGIRADAGYSIPDTLARPKEVRVARQVPDVTAPTGTGQPAPDKNSVTYSTAPISLTNADFVNGVYTVPYGAAIRSLDNMVPAVDFSNVTVRPAKIIGRDVITNTRGIAWFGGYASHVELDLENCYAFDYDKTLPDTRGWGKYMVRVNNPKQVRLVNCYVEDMGLFMAEYGRDQQAGCFGFTIARNYGKNIYGPGDYQNFIKVVSDGATVPGMLVEWNQTLNIDGQCRLEDTMNFYHTSGTADSPAIIRHNFIDGASKDPLATSYTGGGIMIDCAGDATAIQIPKYWLMHDNQGVRCHNYLFATSGAQYTKLYNNRGVVAAVSESGTPYPDWSSGLWTGNYNGMATGVEAYDNVMGVNDLYGGRTTEFMFNNNETGHTTHYNNTSIAGTITRATEDAEYTLWNSKLNSYGVVVGPVTN